MSAKPSKSRNLVLVKGKILNENALSLKVNKSIHSIPLIIGKPVRFLVRTISDTLSVRDEVESFSLTVTKGLALIN